MIMTSFAKSLQKASFLQDAPAPRLSTRAKEFLARALAAFAVD